MLGLGEKKKGTPTDSHTMAPKKMNSIRKKKNECPDILEKMESLEGMNEDLSSPSEGENNSEELCSMTSEQKVNKRVKTETRYSPPSTILLSLLRKKNILQLSKEIIGKFFQKDQKSFQIISLRLGLLYYHIVEIENQTKQGAIEEIFEYLRSHLDGEIDKKYNRGPDSLTLMIRTKERVERDLALFMKFMESEDRDPTIFNLLYESIKNGGISLKNSKYINKISSILVEACEKGPNYELHMVDSEEKEEKVTKGKIKGKKNAKIPKNPKIPKISEEKLRIEHNKRNGCSTNPEVIEPFLNQESQSIEEVFNENLRFFKNEEFFGLSETYYASFNETSKDNEVYPLVDFREMELEGLKYKKIEKQNCEMIDLVSEVEDKNLERNDSISYNYSESGNKRIFEPLE